MFRLAAVDYIRKQLVGVEVDPRKKHKLLPNYKYLNDGNTTRKQLKTKQIISVTINHRFSVMNKHMIYYLLYCSKHLTVNSK